MQTEKKRVLVTAKAYPNPSRKYGETVCCAGIDLDTYQWIRLYPIQFRDLDMDQRFKKYTIVELKCSRATVDSRPESFKVIQDSIKPQSWLDSSNNWSERKAHVLKLPLKSMCQMLMEAKNNESSLGLIKPEAIAFSSERKSPGDKHKREACYSQLSFFNPQKNAIEEIPFDFYFKFKCHSKPQCLGHKLAIIDWEIGQAYRDWRTNYTEEELLLRKIQERWLSIADTSKNDVYFYVGNMKRFRDIFMVLGVFFPKKT